MLKPYVTTYKSFDENFHFLFNSYYGTLGSRTSATTPRIDNAACIESKIIDTGTTLMARMPADGHRGSTCYDKPEVDDIRARL